MSTYLRHSITDKRVLHARGRAAVCEKASRGWGEGYCVIAVTVPHWREARAIIQFESHTDIRPSGRCRPDLLEAMVIFFLPVFAA